MEEQKLFGKLFNTIPLHDENHLETILVTMNKETNHQTKITTNIDVNNNNLK